MKPFFKYLLKESQILNSLPQASTCLGSLFHQIGFLVLSHFMRMNIWECKPLIILGNTFVLRDYFDKLPTSQTDDHKIFTLASV